MSKIKEILSIWDKACRGKIRWYLFKETLLCAVGYRRFSEELMYPQVVCFGEEFTEIYDVVLTGLPANWELDVKHFGRGKHLLLFYDNSVPVLELCVLYGGESLEEIYCFNNKVRQIVNSTNKIMSCNSLGNRFDFYRCTFNKVIKKIVQHKIKKNFYDIVALVAKSKIQAAFYTDILTNQKPNVLMGSYFESDFKLYIDGISYPVFCGYKEYLTNVFGDYQNGLYDDVGCGLTVEEKVELKLHQEKCMDVLRFLQSVSDEYKLQYYLLAGSVLGCIRHNGIIPWDDDIDIGIRIEELERFEAVIEEEIKHRLPEGFLLMKASADNPYPRMFSKICYNGRCCVDLWPLVPTYDDGRRAKFLWRFGKVMRTVHYIKIGHNVGRFRKIAKFIGLFLTDKMVMCLARYNERIYCNNADTSYINLYSIYNRKKETIKRSWIDENKTAFFNGLEVPVIGCTDEYLTNLYGDYMRKPPPWKRASRHIERF